MGRVRGGVQRGSASSGPGGLQVADDLRGQFGQLAAFTARGLAQQLEGVLPLQAVAHHGDADGYADVALGIESGLQLAARLAQALELVGAREGRLDGRQQLRRVQRLDQIAQCAMTAGLVDQRCSL